MKFDLEKILKLTEECHEVTIMWFTKEGKSMGDPNGSPDLLLAMLEGIKELKQSLAHCQNQSIDYVQAIDSLKNELEKIAKATVSDLASAKVVVLAAHNRLSAENVTPRDLRNDPVVHAVNKLVMQRENEIIRELRSEVAELKAKR